MKELNFDNAFMFTLWASITALVFGLIFTIFSDKPVQGYYLSGGVSPITIMVDIDNYPDESIELVDVSYEEAVELVNELNKPYTNK